MSLFKNRLTVQGKALVERAPDGEVTKRAVALEKSPKLVNFRSQLRQVTRGGLDQLATLANIANGLPWRAELPDGSTTDWMVPTTAERAEAARFLLEYQHGKAVPQTEVLKAEKEAEDLEQYRAMSDAELLKAATPFLERVGKKAEGEE